MNDVDTDQRRHTIKPSRGSVPRRFRSTTSRVGHSIPSRVRDSPVFSLSPSSESTIAEVFALFDRIDQWKAAQLPEATAWIDSGLDVRYDEGFRALLELARSEKDFDTFLHASELEHDRFVNMDF